MLFGLLALVAASIFAGAAIYVSAVEHPARAALDPGSALAQWKPAYARGAVMQASLAVLGFVLGLTAFLTLGGLIWLVGGLLMLANWPWTLLVVMPVNARLKATGIASAGPETQALLDRWAALHAVRTGLGVAATLAFVWAALD